MKLTTEKTKLRIAPVEAAHSDESPTEFDPAATDTMLLVRGADGQWTLQSLAGKQSFSTHCSAAEAIVASFVGHDSQVSLL